ACDRARSSRTGERLPSLRRAKQCVTTQALWAAATIRQTSRAFDLLELVSKPQAQRAGLTKPRPTAWVSGAPIRLRWPGPEGARHPGESRPFRAWHGL